MKHLQQDEHENTRLKKQADARRVRAVLSGLTDVNTDAACIGSGKSWHNRSNESFDARLHDVCLDNQWFKNRIDAKILSEDLRREFNGRQQCANT